MKNARMGKNPTDESRSESNKPACMSITQALPTAQPMPPQYLVQISWAHVRHPIVHSKKSYILSLYILICKTEIIVST